MALAWRATSRGSAVGLAAPALVTLSVPIRYVLAFCGYWERYWERSLARPWHMMEELGGAGTSSASNTSVPVPAGSDAESVTPTVEGPTPTAPPRRGAEEDEEADEDTSWFYAPEWQEGERRVDEYIRRGEVWETTSVDELIDRLERLEAVVAEPEQSADSGDPSVRG
jgi:hypothetical protein